MTVNGLRTAIVVCVLFVSAFVSSTALAQEIDCEVEQCAYTQGVPGQQYDSDWDGVSDSSESYWGTSVYDADTDNDGIQDGAEYSDLYGRSDPTLYDTDYDGLGDGYEVFSNNSDPQLYDTDGDGRPDGNDSSPRDPYR